jgi:hypothetical protein
MSEGGIARILAEGSLYMARVRNSNGGTLADVVDLILDKGIVIDAWVRVSLVGIEILTVEARVVIASVDTYLKYADAIGVTATAAVPPLRRRTAAP